MSETEIAEAFGMNTSELRAKKAKDRDAFTKGRDNAVYRLADKQWSAKAISQRLGIPQQTVYKIMKRRDEVKAGTLNATIDILKQAVEKDKYVDVGKGVNQHMGISEDRLKKARKTLQAEGYT